MLLETLKSSLSLEQTRSPQATCNAHSSGVKRPSIQPQTELNQPPKEAAHRSPKPGLRLVTPMVPEHFEFFQLVFPNTGTLLLLSPIPAGPLGCSEAGSVTQGGLPENAHAT